MSYRMLPLALCAFVTLVSASAAWAVDLKEVKKEVDEGKAVLLDVREEVEWKKAHLVKAELVPLSTIATDAHAKKAIEKYTKDPDLKIYAYCQSGKRSVVASDMFKRVKADVIPITQSYQDLLDAGFKQTKGTDPKYDPPINVN